MTKKRREKIIQIFALLAIIAMVASLLGSSLLALI